MGSQASTAASTSRSAVPPPEQGRLQDVGIVRLLRAQTSRKRTGILSFRCANAIQYRVYFLEGDIVAADSDAEDLRLGSLLYRLNKISLDQLEESIDGATGEQQLGEILVEKGFLSSKERQECLSAQFHEILNAVFLLEEAEYAFVSQETIFAENLQLFHDTDALIEDGEQLLEGISQLTRDLEANNHVYEIAKRDFVPSRRDEEELLRYVDGRRTASEIFELSPFDRMATAHILKRLIIHEVIREVEPAPTDQEAPPSPEEHPSPEASAPATDTPEPADRNPRTVVRVGRSNSEDVEAGLFFSSQSVLDRVDLSHVDNYRFARAPEHHDVVETLDADDESREAVDDVPVPTHEDEAETILISPAEAAQQDTDLEDLSIEMDSEGDGLSELFDGPSEEFSGLETSDADALLHIATDDIEFQETQVDVPLFGGGDDTDTSGEAETIIQTRVSTSDQAPPLRHGFPEHPEVAEVTIEEDIDEEEYAEILAKHIESIEGPSRIEEIEAHEGARIVEESRGTPQDDGLTVGELPPFDSDEPLFREPPVLSDLSDDEIVIESGLDAPDEAPLMETPEPLAATGKRAGQSAQQPISKEQQEILDSITSLFKKPGARAAFGTSTEPWLSTSNSSVNFPLPSDSLEGKDQSWMLNHGGLYNEVFATLYSYFREKLGDDQTRQIFDSFFMPGNSSYPELFIDVQFSEDGKLDVNRMVHNLSAYGTNHPADVFDACLNEVFYFLIRDLHLVLDQAEQDSLMKTIMPTRERLFQARFGAP